MFWVSVEMQLNAHFSYFYRKLHMPKSIIKGLGFYVPDQVVTNHDLSKIMDTNDAWIQERTGIQERRWVRPGEDTTSGMGVKAAKIAIERAGIPVIAHGKQVQRVLGREHQTLGGLGGLFP